MTRYTIQGNKLLKVLTLVSLMSPPFIGAYSWILILGNNGSVRLFFEKIDSIMLYVGGTCTMPVATYSEIIYGRFGSAAAMSTLLVCIIAIVLSIFFQVTKKQDGLV